mmetsp:Transcript_79372/g.184183  ORF Transcript_79372/g.184183 Transcript_79372/m.184183 type:complete len:693 (-) Transcript_79372:201-2279(-)
MMRTPGFCGVLVFAKLHCVVLSSGCKEACSLDDTLLLVQTASAGNTSSVDVNKPQHEAPVKLPHKALHKHQLAHRATDAGLHRLHKHGPTVRKSKCDVERREPRRLLHLDKYGRGSPTAPLSAASPARLSAPAPLPTPSPAQALAEALLRVQAGRANRPSRVDVQELVRAEIEEARRRVEKVDWHKARQMELQEAKRDLDRLMHQQSRDAKLKAFNDTFEKRRHDSEQLRSEQKKRRADAHAGWVAQKIARQETAARKKREAQMSAEREALWKAQEDDLLQAEFGMPMNLTIQDPQGRELHVRFRSSTRLQILMEHIGRKLGLQPISQLNLTHNGRLIGPEDTPAALGIQDHDTVQVDAALDRDASGDAAKGEDVVLGEEADKVHLIVRAQEGHEVHVHILKTTRLQVLIGFACKRLGLEMPQVRFIYNRTWIKPGDTAERLGLTGGDVLKVEPNPEYFERLREAGEAAKPKALETEEKQRTLEDAKDRERGEVREHHLQEIMERNATIEAEKAAKREARLKAEVQARQAKFERLEEANRRQLEAEVRAKQAEEDEEAKRAKYGKPMFLVVKDEQSRQLLVKFRKQTQMKALMKFACKHWGLDPSQTDFTHFGVAIEPGDTPQTLGLQDHDTIEVTGRRQSAEARLGAVNRATWRHSDLHRARWRWRAASRATSAEGQTIAVVEPDLDTEMV